MALIRFENGVSVRFEGTPTPEDIEEISKKVSSVKPKEPEKKISYFENAWNTVKKGASEMVEKVGQRADEIGEIKNSDQNIASKGLQMFGKGVQTGVSDIVGGVLDTGVRAITPDVIGEPIEKGVGVAFQKTGELGSKIPGVSKLADKYVEFETKHPEAAKNVVAGGQVVQGALDLAMAGQAGNFAVKKTTQAGELVSGGVKTAVDTTKSAVNKVVPKVAEKIKNPLSPKTSQQVAEELSKIENQYSQLRKAGEYSKDNLAGSRGRISNTDVLAGSIDDTGTIRTKTPGGAVEQYRSQTIEGSENVVRENLVKLGEKVSLKNVEAALTEAVHSSGLVGKDLTTALNNIKKEIAGYTLKADKDGMILLENIHDAKIGTTRAINFQTPPEVASYRKAIAQGLKKTIEKYSSFDVQKVNAELAKYYKDLEYLELLDGKKVAGGKLGKYMSQGLGMLTGSLAGAAVGGPFGGAFGAIAGSEAGSWAKGKIMQNVFGKATGKIAPRSTILDEAIQSSKNVTTNGVKITNQKGIPSESNPNITNKTNTLLSENKRLEKPAQKDRSQKTAIKLKSQSAIQPNTSTSGKNVNPLIQEAPFNPMGRDKFFQGNHPLVEKWRKAVNDFKANPSGDGLNEKAKQAREIAEKEFRKLQTEYNTWESQPLQEGGTITLYRAAPKFPTDKFNKGTYFADNADAARYYSESHYNGNPSDIKVEKFTLPKNAVFREPSTGNYTLKNEVPVSLQEGVSGGVKTKRKTKTRIRKK